MKQFESEEDTAYLVKQGQLLNTEIIRNVGYRLGFYSIDELFTKCFKNVKIFLINYQANVLTSHGTNYYLKFYAIDINTSNPLIFKSNSQFFDFINSSVRPIAQLDKTYLYLALYLNILQKYYPRISISIPVEYNDSIRANTSKKDEELMFKGWNGGSVFVRDKSAIPPQQRARDISASNSGRIIVYALFNYLDGLRVTTITYRFIFMFDAQNNMCTAKIDTL